MRIVQLRSAPIMTPLNSWMFATSRRMTWRWQHLSNNVHKHNLYNRQRICCKNIKKKTPWSESASELYRPRDRRLSAKWLPTFADKGCHVVSVTDPYGRTFGFRQEPLLFYQVAPQLYWRGWVDPRSCKNITSLYIILCVQRDDGQWRPKHVAVEVK
jgi:hypothetical protein